MANCCDFNMRITGSEQSIRELLRLMEVPQSKLNTGSSLSLASNFYRTYEALLYLSDETSLWIDGYCAWSVQLCFIDEQSTWGINLVSISKKLNLEITIKSLELGCGFSEYYVIKNGEIVTDTCKEVDYYYFYDEDDEFIEEREAEYESFLNID